MSLLLISLSIYIALDAEKEPKGFINMKEVTCICARAPDETPRDLKATLTNQPRYAFEIHTPGRVWLLLAQSEERRRYWVEGLQRYTNRK
jgi:hypothetical protein